MEPTAVVGAIATQMLRLPSRHVQVETRLHQCDPMMIGGVRAHGDRQPMAIRNREDLHAFRASGLANAFTPALG